MKLSPVMRRALRTYSGRWQPKNQYHKTVTIHGLHARGLIYIRYRIDCAIKAPGSGGWQIKLTKEGKKHV